MDETPERPMDEMVQSGPDAAAHTPSHGGRRRGKLLPILGAAAAVVLIGAGALFFSGILALDTSTGTQAASTKAPKPASTSTFDGSSTDAPAADSSGTAKHPTSAEIAAAAQAAAAAAQKSAKPYGDWVYTCQTPPGATAPTCAILQQLSDTKSKATIFVWRIIRANDGTLVASWEMPTGVLVNRGMVLDAGTPKPIAIPYTACTNQHCEAVANLAPDFIATLTNATKISATIFPVQGNGLSFPFSVNGLKDALAALQK